MVEAYTGWSIQEKQDEVYKMKHIRNTRWNIHDEVYGKYKWKLNVRQYGWKLDLGKYGWKPNVGKYWWKLNVRKLDEVVRVLGINFKVLQILRNLSFIFIFMFSYFCISFFITFLLFSLALTFFPPSCGFFFPFSVFLFIFFYPWLSLCVFPSPTYMKAALLTQRWGTQTMQDAYDLQLHHDVKIPNTTWFFSLSIIFVFSSFFCVHISFPKHTIHSVFFVYVFTISFSFYMCLSLSTFRSKNFKHNLKFFLGQLSLCIFVFFFYPHLPLEAHNS